MLKLFQYQFTGEEHFEQTDYIEGTIIALNEDDVKKQVYELYKDYSYPKSKNDISVWELQFEGYKITIEKI